MAVPGEVAGEVAAHDREAGDTDLRQFSHWELPDAYETIVSRAETRRRWPQRIGWVRDARWTAAPDLDDWRVGHAAAPGHQCRGGGGLRRARTDRERQRRGTCAGLQRPRCRDGCGACWSRCANWAWPPTPGAAVGGRCPSWTWSFASLAAVVRAGFGQRGRRVPPEPSAGVDADQTAGQHHGPGRPRSDHRRPRRALRRRQAGDLQFRQAALRPGPPQRDARIPPRTRRSGKRSSAG